MGWEVVEGEKIYVEGPYVRAKMDSLNTTSREI